MAVSDAVIAFKIGPAQPTQQGPPPPTSQTAAARPSQTEVLPEDAGKATVVKVCGQCHAVEQAVSIRGTGKDWRDVVDSMIEKGASGTPEEFETAIAYLAKHFGPKH